MPDGQPWFNRIIADKSRTVAGFNGGVVTLTKTDDGTYTLWIYDHALLTGDAATVRPRYAEHLHGHWLAKYYR